MLALAYGGFSFTQQTHEVGIGALSLSIDERRYVGVPVWAGIGAVVIGGLLLLGRGGRS